MKKLINTITVFLIALAMCSCIKESVAAPVKKGAAVWLISYKYSVDTVLLKTDTIWYDLNLPYDELVKIKKVPAVSWLLFCDAPIPQLPAFLLEKRVYVIYEKGSVCT